MELEACSIRGKALGFVLAAATIGSLMAIGYAVTRPRGRSKRLVNSLDKKLVLLEEKLRLAVPQKA
ncbi:MAG TPA: hypothetical protein VK934_00670 [Fimbriimonas sp.]|nr:hypothetical protein [Fimbriimonas sp.]